MHMFAVTMYYLDQSPGAMNDDNGTPPSKVRITAP